MSRSRPRHQRLPWPVLVLGALALAFFALPLVGLLWRAPWSEAAHILGEPGVRAALRLSLICSFCATATSVVFGVPVAWLLARVNFPGP